jgi:hypothetical protein
MLAHLRHGIPKLEMHACLINRFELTEEQKAACEKYYILRWKGAHFKQVLENGTIAHQGVRYLVIYKDCKPTDIVGSSSLYVSFRKPAKEYELQAYVLVSVRR